MDQRLRLERSSGEPDHREQNVLMGRPGTALGMQASHRSLGESGVADIGARALCKWGWARWGFVLLSCEEV